MTGNNWRAVYCKPREERRAEAHLENQGFKVFLPRVRTTGRRRGRPVVRVEPMFPRYLFIDLEAHTDDWSAIRSTRGVAGLVRFGDQFPVVPDRLIADLLARHAESGVVDLSAAQRLQENDPIEIVDGALAGLRALYRCQSGAERVIILLDLLNHQRTLEMPREYIRKAV